MSAAADFPLPPPRAIALWPVLGRGCYSPAEAMLIAKAYHSWKLANDNPGAYKRQIAELTAALAEMCAKIADEH